jgi:hypothetical protein
MCANHDGAGMVKLSVQVADNDMRPLLYRVPLAEDPQQLQAEAEPEASVHQAAAAGKPATQHSALVTTYASFAAAASGLFSFNGQSSMLPPGAAAGGGSGSAPGAAGAPHASLRGADMKSALSKVLHDPDIDPLVAAMFTRDPATSTAGRGHLGLGLPLHPGSPCAGGVSQRLHSSAWQTGLIGSLSGFGGSSALSTAQLHPGYTQEQHELQEGGMLADRPGLATAPSGVVPLECPIAQARRRSLGSVLIRIQSLNASGALSGSCCVIIKCGPHWMRSQERHPGETGMHWQVRAPGFRGWKPGGILRSTRHTYLCAVQQHRYLAGRMLRTAAGAVPDRARQGSVRSGITLLAGLRMHRWPGC